MNEQVPYKMVECWLMSLPEWRSHLEILQEQLKHVSGFTQKFEMGSKQEKGQVGDSVFQEVVRRMMLKEAEIPLLSIKIKVLETAIQGLSKSEQQFVEYRYRLRLSTQEVAMKMGVTLRSYYRLRHRSLKHLYEIVGGKNSVLELQFYGEEI